VSDTGGSRATSAPKRAGSRPLRTLAPAALLASLAVPLSAQTTDPLFAGYRFAPPALGSRPAGLGGAFVGIADGVKAAFANPAGLTLIPISEIGLSSGRPWLGAGFGRTRLRVAGYLTQADETHDELAASVSATGGFRDSSTWEAGLGVGVEVHRRLKLGVSAAWSRFHLQAERLASDSDGVPAVAASVDSTDDQIRVTAGLLMILVGANARALPSLRLGVSYQPGFDWSLAQASGPTGATQPVDVRRPTLVSVGLAWRTSDRWSFGAQGDVIRYGEVIDSLRRNVGDAASGFTLRNAVEPRFGAEFVAPLWCGCGIVRLRGGLHYRSPGTLRYSGPDSLATQAFAGESWRTVATLGASFFAEHMNNALRLDVDSRDVVNGPDLSFGIVWRF
jgi:hypothetical protein